MKNVTIDRLELSGIVRRIIKEELEAARESEVVKDILDNPKFINTINKAVSNLNSREINKLKNFGPSSLNDVITQVNSTMPLSENENDRKSIAEKVAQTVHNILGINVVALGIPLMAIVHEFLPEIENSFALGRASLPASFIISAIASAISYMILKKIRGNKDTPFYGQPED